MWLFSQSYRTIFGVRRIGPKNNHRKIRSDSADYVQSYGLNPRKVTWKVYDIFLVAQNLPFWSLLLITYFTIDNFCCIFFFLIFKNSQGLHDFQWNSSSLSKFISKLQVWIHSIIIYTVGYTPGYSKSCLSISKGTVRWIFKTQNLIRASRCEKSDTKKV